LPNEGGLAFLLEKSRIACMKKRFDQKTAVVTGAGSGIGRSSALAFAHEGSSVMVSDIDKEGGEETVQMIKESNGKAHFFPCDVSQSDQVKSLIQVTVDEFGGGWTSP
jgi:NAD(P)-dependent dehydrogenase (short-subunit alcohol dehydrogenase family)